MKNSTKKRLVIAGIAAVCVLLFIGIVSALYKEPVQTLHEGGKTREEAEPIADTEDIPKVQEEIENTEETNGLVIQPETEGGAESGGQEIQPEPVKTENEKPEEPPALPEDADITKTDAPPVYEEPEETTTQANDTPKTGDTRDGMVYVEGFGWLPDEGAGSGTVADDMYENGNKIGIMD